MSSLSFKVYGEPAPQGSKSIINGRLVEASSAKLRKWRREITLTAIDAHKDSGADFQEGAIEVIVKFYVRRGTTVTRALPTVPADLDKYLRGFLDGITDAGVWKDDSQVVKVTCFKVYADDREPGAFAEIRNYNE